MCNIIVTIYWAVCLTIVCTTSKQIKGVDEEMLVLLLLLAFAAGYNGLVKER